MTEQHIQNRDPGRDDMKPLSARQWTLCSLPLCLAALLPAPAQAAGSDQMTLRVTATITAPTCNVAPESENMNVSLGQWSVDYINANSRTQVIPFTLQLTGCDAGAGKSVKVTFRGTGDTSGGPAGLLALTPGATAAGIAIGLVDTNGSNLAVNTESVGIPVNTADLSLKYGAYVARTAGTVTAGNFTAIANFVLAYD